MLPHFESSNESKGQPVAALTSRKLESIQSAPGPVTAGFLVETRLTGWFPSLSEVIVFDNYRRMTWTVTFYSAKVERETLALPPGLLACFSRIVELIEEFGPDLGRPHTAALGHGLFEIRAKAREGVARSVFCRLGRREVIVLNTVVKKGNRIPERYMKTARRRMKEVQHGNRETHI